MRGQPVYKPPSHQINIRQSSNGLGRGDVQPNVWFESNPAHQRFWQFPQLIDNCSPGDGIRNLVVAYKRVIMYAV